MGSDCHISGDTVRAILADDKQDAALEILRRERLRLISLTPVRATLEDYFLQKLQTDEAPVEVTV
jgi:hypothetical protein